MLADMLLSMGAQGVPEVSVWLSEFEGQCQCPECLKSTQTALETKLVSDAWLEAKKQYPNMILRIFFSQGDASEATARALNSLPPEVKIERVYSIFKPFKDAAAEGRWVLSFSGVHCIDRPDCCFASPAWIRPRIEEGFKDKLKGVLSVSFNYFGDGKVIPEYYQVVYSFPLCALAEWSWNVGGRSPRQLAEAWALREGYDNPALFADWLDKMTALKDILAQSKTPGAGLPTEKGFRNPFANAAANIKKGLPLKFYGAQDLEKAKAACAEALALAEKLSKPQPSDETRYFQSLIPMYESLAKLSDALAAPDLSGADSQAKVKELWAAYQSSADAALAANEKWISNWKAEPADYPQKVQKELCAQWLKLRGVMDAAISARLAGK
jgi:hypothetical protein